MNDLEPWSTGRLVQVERKIQDARGPELERLRHELRLLVAEEVGEPRLVVITRRTGRP